MARPGEPDPALYRLLSDVRPVLRMNLKGRTTLWVANGLAAVCVAFLLAVLIHMPRTSASLSFANTENIPVAIQSELGSPARQDAEVAQLYAERNYQPVWFSGGRPSADALQTM